MGKASYLTYFTADELAMIHELTLKIYSETGLSLHHPGAVEIFKKHGAKVEGDRVYITKEIVDKALSTMPSDFKWMARNRDKSLQIGGPDRTIGIHPNIGPIYVQDIENGRRQGTLEDFRKMQIYSQHSQVMTGVGSCPTEPFDVPTENRHLHMFYETLKNTDKPVSGWTLTEKRVNETLEMMEIVFGKDFMENNMVIGASVNALSPLSWSADCLGTIMAYASRNQAIWAPSGGLGGVTDPADVLGCIIQQNAEVLSGLILAQLVRPGAPVAYSASSTLADMRTCFFICGTPQMNQITSGCLQMGREFYKIPTRTMSGISESQEVDVQAGLETMQNAMGTLLSGADMIHESSGVLTRIMVTSFEKMVIDDEIMSRALCTIEGFDSSPEAMKKATELIQKIGPGGSFLTEPSTLKQARKNWLPSISDWKANEREEVEDILVRANRKFKETIAKAPESMIDSELDKELLAYVKSHSQA